MTPFQSFIEQCSEQDISIFISGNTGLGCNDKNYHFSKQGIYLTDLQTKNKQTEKNILKQEQALLTLLYQTKPLCREEFDYQAQQLFKKYSPENFCDHPGNTKHHALMIEDTRLIAVDFNDARNQYGYFCEQSKTLNLSETRLAVMKWLSTGDAYETYRAKTHCRYVCA